MQSSTRFADRLHSVREAGSSVKLVMDLIEPAKQVIAYSLGWSEALRAQPWVVFIRKISVREAGDRGSRIPRLWPRFAGSNPSF